MSKFQIIEFMEFIDEVCEGTKRLPYSKFIGKMTKEPGEASPLEMIFDRASVNDYARIIIDKAYLDIMITEEEREIAIPEFLEKQKKGKSPSMKDRIRRYNPWTRKYSSEMLKDEETKILAAADFVKYCKQELNDKVGYKFIFWCLMILAVDKTNQEEKMGMIYDFAHLLNITKEEMEDIAYVVALVYQKDEEEHSFASEIVPQYFSFLISEFTMKNNNKSQNNTESKA